MKFRAEIDIMPHAELLDPQGKTVMKNMKNINVEGVEDVRIGKHISMVFEAADEKAAHKLTHQTCKKLLANVIMEKYEFELQAVEVDEPVAADEEVLAPEADQMVEETSEAQENIPANDVEEETSEVQKNVAVEGIEEAISEIQEDTEANDVETVADNTASAEPMSTEQKEVSEK
ncbi:MAG: phosphoribosylformylglycinamidine synthase subunit PurS [Bacteroidota bacterium]